MAGTGCPTEDPPSTPTSGSAEERFLCLFDAAEASADVCIEAHEFPVG